MKNENVKKQKVSKFIADAETQAKAKAVLQELLLKVNEKVIQNPALAIVKEQINVIDELQTKGATLAQIYEHLNSALKIGITSASFTQYVRSVRKETGSPLLKKYKARAKKSEVAEQSYEKAPADSTDVASNAVATENHSANEIVTSEVQKKNGIASDAVEEKLNCEYCKTESKRFRSNNDNKIYWKCEKCQTKYADKDGKLTSEIITANTKKD